jgi:SagB-type dehydrogenase family enzyme
MKRLFVLILLGFTSLIVTAQSDTLWLPKPVMEGGKPLMEALRDRHTARKFKPDALPMQQVSNLLWAACGVNRPDEGRRTAPTARNWQEIDVYVAFPDAAYKFDALKHCLIKVVDGDVRKNMGKQSFCEEAPVVLAYVSNLKTMGIIPDDMKKFYSATDTGFISQNVYLFCASEGLSTVVLGYIDRDDVMEGLKLGKDQYVVLTQVVGMPKSD